MERHIMWQPWTGPGLEHLHLLEDKESVLLDSVTIGVQEQTPFRVWYEIRTDNAWRVRECNIRLLGRGRRELVLYSDGEGHWSDNEGSVLPELDGCIDVDMSHTPVTNTLPIRRLAFTTGHAERLLMVYIAVPELTVKPLVQRYTCLECSAEGGLYRYEGLESGFTTELRVDDQGFVIDYPDLYKRVSIVP